MDLTPYRMIYLQETMEQMAETEDTDYLFELYKEAQRTFSIIMNELLTKEKEKFHVPFSFQADAAKGTGATLVKIEEYRKKNNL
ncbi:hypothetical protein [Sutcliffiella horikoshii]|uniref:hypothetical protein n=1 Tax=Sutcliffiella horikoshii TaxID=79883 RepID=UPI003CF9E04A